MSNIRTGPMDIVQRLKTDPLTDPRHTSQAIVDAVDEIEMLRAKIKTVLETFERDEAQGYRSRDRQFAISILK